MPNGRLSISKILGKDLVPFAIDLAIYFTNVKKSKAKAKTSKGLREINCWIVVSASITKSIREIGGLKTKRLPKRQPFLILRIGWVT
jgi:hypothetical protein